MLPLNKTIRFNLTRFSMLRLLTLPKNCDSGPLKYRLSNITNYYTEETGKI